MSQAIFTKEFSVNTMVLNSNKRLGLVGLLGMLQDAAGLHADELGFGYEQMVISQTFWVLTRQNLVMDQWPLWGDTVRIVTWPRPLNGPIATRDFEIYVGDRKYGECTTGWMILDGKTRKPSKQVIDGERVQVRKDYALAINPTKVPFQEDARSIKIVEVRNSDLDMNNHVNNTKYAQWILDAIPLDKHRSMALTGYEINFLAETYLDDVITLQRAPQVDESDIKDIIYQGIRQKDLKPVFTARIQAKPWL